MLFKDGKVAATKIGTLPKGSAITVGRVLKIGGL